VRAAIAISSCSTLDDIANTCTVSRVYMRGVEVDRAALKTRWRSASQ
jgi:hypothetical protein